MARPVGSKTKKRSEYVKHQLINKHNFNLIGEYVELYRDTKSIYKKILEVIISNTEEGLDPLTGLTDNEVEVYNKSRKDLHTMLKQLFGYVFPKLAAVAVEQGVSDSITFNIMSTPAVDKRPAGPPLSTGTAQIGVGNVIDVTPEKEKVRGTE